MKQRSTIAILTAAIALSATAGAAVASNAGDGVARKPSPLVAWASDGVPIYGPRGPHGKLIRASDLDACRGHTHRVMLRGELVRIYHYHRLRGEKRPPGCAVFRRDATTPLPAVSIRLSPDSFPAFDPAISDYVVRCDGAPVGVTVTGQGSESVSVDGAGARSGDFDEQVPLAAGQAFTISAVVGRSERDYHVRCLPQDFPAWDFARFGEPDAEYYVVTPSISFVQSVPNYTVIFDQQGVPVWWYASTATPIDGKVLDDGSIAWGRFDGGTGYEIRSLDGTLLRQVGVWGGSTDPHDMVELGNGDLLLLEYKPRQHVDLTAYGGSADATVGDAVIHEVDPSGNDVWSWDSKDHIALDETGRWWATALAQTPVDPVHMNSMEVNGSSLVVSARHLDAVYSIDRTTGDIQWKLGGTSIPQSLTVLDDPYSPNPFGGQHDARILPDGTLTVHDNGTAFGRPPRAVRYSIDQIARTATLLESVSDPAVTDAVCCGSARRAADGSWLMGWGANSLVEELAPDGNPNFTLSFGSAFSYRAVPVPAGRLTAPALRAGMSSMFPR